MELRGIKYKVIAEHDEAPTLDRCIIIKERIITVDSKEVVKEDIEELIEFFYNQIMESLKNNDHNNKYVQIVVFDNKEIEELPASAIAYLIWKSWAPKKEIIFLKELPSRRKDSTTNVEPLKERDSSIDLDFRLFEAMSGIYSMKEKVALLKFAIDIIMEKLGFKFKYSRAWLLQEKDKTVFLNSYSSLPNDTIESRPLSDSIIVKAFKRSSYLLIDKELLPEKEYKYYPELKDKLLIIPLQWEGRILGFIEMWNLEDPHRRFSERRFAGINYVANELSRYIDSVFPTSDLDETEEG